MGGSVKIIDSLYTYGLTDRKIDKVLKRMQKGKIIKDLHVVTLPLFGDGILEIYKYDQLLQPFYKKIEDDICVIGLAANRSMASELVMEIIQNMYDAGYLNDAKGFLGI